LKFITNWDISLDYIIIKYNKPNLVSENKATLKFDQFSENEFSASFPKKGMDKTVIKHRC